MTLLPPQSTILLATRNRGKLHEFRTLLAKAAWQVLSLADLSIEHDCDETGASFAENARLKALEYSIDAALPVLADDSGLEVFALGGRPGIHSARFAGPEATDEDRIRQLLLELASVSGPRDARFVCALTLAQQGKVLLEVEGECRGVIAREPRGSNGFGYDPVFLFPGLGRTYAELSEEEKNRHSHRARAVALLLDAVGLSLTPDHEGSIGSGSNGQSRLK